MKPSMDFHIRNADFEDVIVIYTLIKAHPRELLPRSVSDIVQNIDRFLVCEIKGRIVGTAAWQILPEIGRATQPSIEIMSVAVDKGFQSKGVGAAMVRAVIRRVKVYHPVQIVVLTFSPDYFRQFGFREVPKETLMHKLYMGCINCTKYESPFTCPEVAMTLAVRARGKKVAR